MADWTDPVIPEPPSRVWPQLLFVLAVGGLVVTLAVVMAIRAAR